MFDTQVIFLKDVFLKNPDFEKKISRRQAMVNMINYSLGKESMIHRKATHFVSFSDTEAHVVQ